jgi:hypothetical protein
MNPHVAAVIAAERSCDLQEDARAQATPAPRSTLRERLAIFLRRS